ncbi:MAG: glyoxalase [Proteobacteria bacterium SG_bin5]|nr:VOC family protein [Sphingomonas sp.]OQW44000.1 MAG: glyoxalase [Proteobacteria bacterium SG_bin5]
MPVLGLGGFFFRARDPGALRDWYREVLGVGNGCGADAEGQTHDWCWSPAPGPLVFEPFAADSDYFKADRAYMLNLRVSELDALLADLRARGVSIETRAEWDDQGIGRFARLHDPEGNPIELWEPPTPARADRVPQAL